MKIKALKREARSLLKGNWEIAIGILFVNALIALIINIPSFISDALLSELSVISISITIVTQIISMPLSVGLAWFYLNLFDGKALNLKQIFDGYKQGKKVLGIQIMTTVFIFLWSLLLLIPGIIKGISYAQAVYLIKDHPEWGVFEAITESRRIMKGYKWKYFLINLSFIAWIVVVPVVLFLGLTLTGQLDNIALIIGAVIITVLYTIGMVLYLIPYLNTTFAAFYRQLNPISTQQETL